MNSPIGKQYVSQTPETLVIFANGIRLSEIQLKNKGQAVPPYFEESYNEAMDKYQKAKQGFLLSERIEVSENKQNSFNSEKGYNKPIYILMDGACGSSCESTIDVFEEHPKVKRVGQNTRGTLQFGNVGKILLPHSCINVQIPTHYNEYRDKRIIEKIGIKPDIEVPKGVDAYNFIFMAATY